MSGYTFEVEELAWLLTVVNASGIAGVDDPRLSPSAPAEREATYSKGVTSLKAHGWLAPADRADSFHLDDTLAQLVLSLAEPAFAIHTVVEDAASEPKAVLHYIAPNGIAELSVTSDGIYTLGAVLDADSLVERLAGFLGAQASASSGAGSIPAVNTLAESPSPHGEIIVARTQRNALLDAHRAEAHAGTWLARRASPNATVTVTPLNADTLKIWLAEFIRMAPA